MKHLASELQMALGNLLRANHNELVKYKNLYFTNIFKKKIVLCPYVRTYGHDTYP